MDKDDDELLKAAKDAYKLDKEHWDSIYTKAREDLQFLSDTPGAMWSDGVYNERVKSGRPALELDYLTQYINQVQNNIRESERTIDVVPEGNAASVATAEMLKGLLRQIQYQSDATVAYETASMSAIKCSIGYVKVGTDYVDKTTFNQHLTIERVINPFLYYPDHKYQTVNGADQRHCFELEPMTAKEFKEKYPDAAVVGFDADDKIKSKEIHDNDEILIVNWYVKESEEEELEAQGANGAVQKRLVTKDTIAVYKMAGQDVLERSTFPGEFIPIVPVVGIEAWEDGERKLHSLIRKAKPGQKGYNLAQSLKLEVLMKAPQAGVMTPAGAIENYADDWKDPAKSMALRYDTKDAEGNDLPPPQRLEAPGVSPGFIEAANSSVNDIRASMGLYQSNIGEQGPEQSGVAIKARTIQGDLGQYHWGDNLVHSITQVGRICVSACPFVYDTARVVQVINEEDSPELVGINGLTLEGQEAVHNLKEGQYGVRVTVGASYTTRRQEAEKFYGELVARNPQLLNIMGDLLFKYSDFDGAQEMAARMRKIMPPQLAQDDGSDPQVAMLTQRLNMAAQQIQALQAQLKDKTTDQQIKAAAVEGKNRHGDEKHQIELLKTVLDAIMQDKEIEIKEHGTAGNLALDAGKLLHQAKTAANGMGVTAPYPAVNNVPGVNGGTP